MEIRDERSRWVRWLDDLESAPDGLVARSLAPLAGLYAGGSRLLRALSGEDPLPDPPFTLGVGNVRVGGTGKTPVTADLGRRFLERGHRVAVVTRGYRATEGGDEPAWLARELGAPVFVDPSRRAGVARAREQGADLVLLDDALQTRHRPSLRLAILLEGDLDRPPRVLPAGPAREAPSRALQRADAWLLRLEGPGDLAARLEGLRDRARSRGLGPRPLLGVRLGPRSLRPPDDGEPWSLDRAAELGPTVLVSGLARPASFETDALGAGVRAVASLRWDDHCDPTAAQVAPLVSLAERHGATSFLCPEKNRSRLLALNLRLPCFSLVSALEWSVPDPLAVLGDRLPAPVPA